MAELQKLVGALNYTCSSYLHKCQNIHPLITEFHKKGHKVDTSFTVAYIKKIFSNGLSSYGSCMNNNSFWLSTIMAIFEYITPTEEIMSLLISSFVKTSSAKVATEQNIIKM